MSETYLCLTFFLVFFCGFVGGFNYTRRGR